MARWNDLLRNYVAMLTPYKPGTWEIDEAQQRENCRYFLNPTFVDNNPGMIINPEAGEVFYLTREEKRRNIEIALEEVGDKMPVFSGVSALWTEEQISHAKDAKELGVDGIFLMPPLGAGDVTTAWNPTKHPGPMVDMVKAVADAVDLPVIVHPTAPYLPPWGGGIPLSTMLTMLDEVPQIIGWKMTYSYDGWRIIAQALKQYSKEKRKVGIMAAPGIFFQENLANRQFDGTVTGSFTYALEIMLEHILAWQNWEVRKACEIWEEGGLRELQEYVYADFSRLHIRYKTAAWLRGFTAEPYMRSPMPRPTREEVQTLRKLLSACGIDLIDEARAAPVLQALR